MPFSLASRSHRDNVGCEIPDQAESADAVDPPGTSSFLTMLALKAALYSLINNLTHPQRRWRPQPHHGEDGPDNSSDTGGGLALLRKEIAPLRVLRPAPNFANKPVTH